MEKSELEKSRISGIEKQSQTWIKYGEMVKSMINDTFQQRNMEIEKQSINDIEQWLHRERQEQSNREIAKSAHRDIQKQANFRLEKKGI